MTVLPCRKGMFAAFFVEMRTFGGRALPETFGHGVDRGPVHVPEGVFVEFGYVCCEGVGCVVVVFAYGAGIVVGREGSLCLRGDLCAIVAGLIEDTGTCERVEFRGLDYRSW